LGIEYGIRCTLGLVKGAEYRSEAVQLEKRRY
jgi:hypothetical protein